MKTKESKSEKPEIEINISTISDSEKLLGEIREILEDGADELSANKKPVFDNFTKQFSIKIPKSLALKAGLNKDSEFSIIFNPKNLTTFDKISQSRLIIYLKEEQNGGEKEKST